MTGSQKFIDAFSDAAERYSNMRPAYPSALFAAQALHWFDLDRFFSEVRRVGRSAPRRKIAADGDEFVRVARLAFEAAWGDPARSRHVVMPLTLRLGRLRATH